MPSVTNRTWRKANQRESRFRLAWTAESVSSGPLAPEASCPIPHLATTRNTLAETTEQEVDHG